MSTFIALPVSQGDAFYLDNGKKILVDGGRSKSAISPFVNDKCKTDYLDILVCTHNDADHANGVLGLLKYWSGTIEEVWLPGNWTALLRKIFSAPYEFYESIVQGIYDLRKRENNIVSTSLEEISKNFSENSINQEHDTDKTKSYELSQIIEESNSTNINLMELSPYQIIIGRSSNIIIVYPRISRNTSLLMEALEAAERIKQIAQLAYHRGCKIRFFDTKFSGPPKGGIPNVLIPVNSTEVATINSKEIGALMYLALTIANKHSLVFYSPEKDNAPSVLFTADSDLDFDLPGNKPSKDIIVTSPHHGSESNDLAYGKVNDWLKEKEITPLWIRSDCKTSKRPGKTYKKQTRRYCTLCCIKGSLKNKVKLYSIKGHWHAIKGSSKCKCK